MSGIIQRQLSTRDRRLAERLDISPQEHELDQQLGGPLHRDASLRNEAELRDEIRKTPDKLRRTILENELNRLLQERKTR